MATFTFNEKTDWRSFDLNSYWSGRTGVSFVFGGSYEWYGEFYPDFARVVYSENAAVARLTYFGTGLQNSGIAMTAGTVQAIGKTVYSSVLADFQNRFSFAGLSLSAVALEAAQRSVGTTDDRALLQTAIAGNDGFYLDDTWDFVFAGTGNDSVFGQGGNDTLEGNGGFDSLYGGAGKDRLYGGGSGDSMFGGLGDDTLEGGIGLDQIFGGDGSDKILGGDNNDSLIGEAGADRIYGGAGYESIDGGMDDDLIYGGGDADNAYGGSGNDTLHGSLGDDQLFGFTGSDKIYGGEGIDRLSGNDGRDSLFGGNGRDSLWGDANNDTMTGGAGADRFVYHSSFGPFGADVINDFEDGIDKIEIGAYQKVFTFSKTASGANTKITFTLTDIIDGAVTGDITLLNIAPSMITAADFDFTPLGPL